MSSHPLQFHFIWEWGKDEMRLRKRRSTEEIKMTSPTPIWFRGLFLFAIPVFNQMSTKELAIRVLEILAGRA